MTDRIARPIIRVPADSGGQDQRLAELGFEFRPINGDDAIYRTAVLPRGWRARGLHRLNPIGIVDRYERLRVTITYGTLPVLQPGGRTGLQPMARMRLITLREYLARSVAAGTPVIPDKGWCTRERIYAYASGEAARVAERGAYFSLIDQGRNSGRFEDQRAAWAALADLYAPTLLESAA